MFTSLPQGLGRMLAVLTIPLLATNVSAQWGPFGDPCGTCGQTAAIAAPQYAAAPINYNPCAQTVAVATACPCMQPVTETVYREVPVTQYRAEKQMVKRPVARTVYEDRTVTAYRQVMEPRTVEVPTVSYQTVQECRPVTINRSHWQTVYQPNPKVSPCQYDGRPGMLGWFNRTGYSMRSAFTPNYVRRRQFVPNVQVVNVPYNRTVSIPGTRQVTYNVAKSVPYETTVKVARVIMDEEDVEVTAMVPYTVTKTVAVGNRTQWAFVNPGLGTTATAIAPTPAKTTEQPIPQKSANSGDIQQHSFETPAYNNVAPRPAAAPSPFGVPAGEPAPRHIDGHGSVKQAPSESQVAGWRATRRIEQTVARPTTIGAKLPSIAAR